MKPGDLVRTKCPGFGTGPIAKTGVVIETYLFGPGSSKLGVIHVLDSTGHILAWYPYQLEIMSNQL